MTWTEILTIIQNIISAITASLVTHHVVRTNYRDKQNSKNKTNKKTKKLLKIQKKLKKITGEKPCENI